VLRGVPEVQTELDRLGVAYRLLNTQSIDHAREEARAAADNGETVVAIGGIGCGSRCRRPDGNEQRARHRPRRRGNDLARVLNIPLEPREAALLLVDGPDHLIDVGTVNDRPFVGIATVGFDSGPTAGETRRGSGREPRVRVRRLRTLAGWKHANFMVTVDGRSTR